MTRRNSVLMILGAAMAAAATTSAIVKADMGVGINDKYEAVNPTQVFANDTPQIFCVWTADAPQGAEARGVWIAEDVGKIAPPNTKIDEAQINVPFSRVGNFSLSKPTKGWPVGKYRVEIYLSGKLAKSVPFSVKAK